MLIKTRQNSQNVKIKRFSKSGKAFFYLEICVLGFIFTYIHACIVNVDE